ncbi:OHCU decarboxylase [Geomicrobium sediminis]|uniref:2-oxo-4-hydroxy-4-carboxy-5-ureidoimidazoline decarboxylase n=1 Tax=Geomicrobium sediminis TaxID=1347788 RepID=A0ABS2P9P7_9BACL|nr:OHCU decarboxylase [Geomicrobium sediminis]
MVTLKQLNENDTHFFTDTLSDVFEHSPWVAEEAADNRPYKTVVEVHERMVMSVEEADVEDQLTLIRSHPKLGAREKMAPMSVAEQRKVGLDQLSDEEYETFLQLNEQYVETFGFPFIKAVKGQSKDAIVEAIQRRLLLTKEEEVSTALQEIYKIAYFRLCDRIQG